MENINQFLQVFVPKVAQKTKQVNQALWLLETTGSSDAADLKAELEVELRMLYSDRLTYEKLLAWDKDPSLKDPLVKRQLNILLRTFKQNLIPQNLMQEIVQKEATLTQTYANFRPQFEGKPISENDIHEILKKENDPTRRKKVWDASKEIGDHLAPQILALVDLRNLAAQSLGYSDYFKMQLDLQDVDEEWLRSIFEELAFQSDTAYSAVLDEIAAEQSHRFHTSIDQLGPWAWNDPFCQEDPLAHTLDSLVSGIDLIAVGKDFYQKVGIDVEAILSRSDMFERPGKNQHAFFIHIDRSGDLRTLNNVQNSMKWLMTVLHELGHAVYELYFDETLPWLLREPPHTLTTEAMALFSGRHPYRYEALCHLIGHSKEKENLMRQVDQTLRRGQLIFSRWVLVMTFFERELYRNPHQDLNSLWWNIVEKYQKIPKPLDREGKNDWAAKFHISLAPVYYYSYLLGEMLASSLEEALVQETGSKNLTSEKAGLFLRQKLFHPGSRLSWNQLVEQATGGSLSPKAWLRQFATIF